MYSNDLYDLADELKRRLTLKIDDVRGDYPECVDRSYLNGLWDAMDIVNKVLEEREVKNG